MTLAEQIQSDITAAMKAREELRLSTLRMVKSALENKRVEKMAALDDKESQAVLATLIKQRKDSIEQFTKGGRKELADKEAAEIVIIEGYLPQALGEAEIAAAVRAAIAEMAAAGAAPTMKEMGAVMKNVMAKFAAAQQRVEGKLVSDTVKRELAPK
ncbi:MAG TPA: GatB/YqeY domain-containing protein [Terriglobales bacterium]|nr:GatB/YqeY domain-containing protein [Terriglobales bacterium]